VVSEVVPWFWFGSWFLSQFDVSTFEILMSVLDGTMHETADGAVDGIADGAVDCTADDAVGGTAPVV
jgi:hypothetical protein